MRLFTTSLLNRILNAVRSYSSLEVYTDGSSKGGVGSWAFVISKNGKVTAESSGRVRRANSNTMEFQAAIEALTAVSEKSKITLHSDSKILVNAMNAGNDPRSHQAQIENLIRLAGKHTIEWKWVKAHNGNKLNERCDELCVLARTVPQHPGGRY